jgi:putative addiction module antidote
MAREITLRQVGGSIGATIPKDMADRLHLGVGDRVLAIETDDGILLTPFDPDIQEALDVAGQAAGRFRNALRDLAR